MRFTNGDFLGLPMLEFTQLKIICCLYSPSIIDIYLDVDVLAFEFLLRVEVSRPVPPVRIKNGQYAVPAVAKVLL